MMHMLKLVPNKVWIVLVAVMCQTMVIFTAYTKGVESERDKQGLARAELVQAEISKGLEETQKALDKALQLQEAKQEVITSLHANLKTSQSRSEELQELLDNVLEQPPTECSTLPDDYYRLYRDMYNKRPAD